MKTVVDGHFRALVSQLLQVENLDDTDNWLEIITSLSWEAASLLKPDTSKGGGMDPGVGGLGLNLTSADTLVFMEHDWNPMLDHQLLVNVWVMIALTYQTSSDRSVISNRSIGGLGLNLTSADTLVFMEHDWNPMLDHQVKVRVQGAIECGDFEEWFNYRQWIEHTGWASIRSLCPSSHNERNFGREGYEPPEVQSVHSQCCHQLRKR
ncbi:Chaperonin Cpn60/TCP-1 [Artemisia annua]|uniref:Chaperonin Cpn60/TCP-1 n=1 Tax=Artemisia annua TaxID=35608 RepID=A0A2U1LWS7_ARTAN|nr:Chaperonin Cpn60/TCP-1 [Artemisia annua]